MKGKRKFTPEFKAEVALEAIILRHGFMYLAAIIDMDGRGRATDHQSLDYQTSDEIYKKSVISNGEKCIFAERK